jgi:hypothetical protein
MQLQQLPVETCLSAREDRSANEQVLMSEAVNGRYYSMF